MKNEIMFISLICPSADNVVPKLMVNCSKSVRRSCKRKKSIVHSGTFLSQILRIKGVSITHGMAKKASNAKDSLHPMKEYCNMPCLSLAPSFFTIIGVKAFSMLLENIDSCPFNWLPIPIAAFNATPKK